MPRGSAHGHAKLDDEAAAAILALRHTDPGLSQAAIAARFGVSQATVQLLLAGKTWTYLPRPDGPAAVAPHVSRKRVPKAYPPELFAPHADRFWSLVDRSSPDGCWPWTGGHVVHGRGMFYVDPAHRDYVASRIAYALDRGEDPGPGMEVCHRCDNPACVRPDHLFIGTPRDNAQDRVAKGRGVVRRGDPKPERQPMKYKPIDVEVVELFAERFHEKHLIGPPSECWEWIRGHRRPVFMLPITNGGQDSYQAERIAWALHNNRDPGPLVVRHTCDNPRCVNPHHLVLGTPKQNVADMLERHGPGHAKLTADDVREMRRQYATGTVSQMDLAASYGISARQVWHVLARRSWAHVD